MFTVILFILILSLLVVVHELGHFITARKCGMKVYEFGIGYPPRAIGVYRDPVTKKWIIIRGKGKSTLAGTVGGDERIEEFPGTVYSLNWLPLGGFCKIKGESGEETAVTDSFGYHTAWKRIIVLVAGVVMNILLAAVLFGVGFTIGLPTDISEGIDDQAIVVTPPQVLVQQAVAGSPAKAAHITTGDRIVKIDETMIASAKELTVYVREHGVKPYALHVVRGGIEMVVTVTSSVQIGDTDGVPRLGLILGDATIIRYPWYIAIYKGFVAAWFGLVNIFIGFFFLLKNLILGQGVSAGVAGPVGIASIVGDSARLGIQYLIQVTAMISLSLAAINILPIPALDGGRAFFVIIEKVTGRKVPMRFEQLAHTIGFVLLLILIVVVTARDISGLFQ